MCIDDDDEMEEEIHITHHNHNHSQRVSTTTHHQYQYQHNYHHQHHNSYQHNHHYHHQQYGSKKSHRNPLRNLDLDFKFDQTNPENQTEIDENAVETALSYDIFIRLIEYKAKSSVMIMIGVNLTFTIIC
uniref:Uncharacterized protein n=1 Tax=Glossina austeni TaxID=7395 RepID=A0A1A9VVM0_GLOAU